MKELYNIKETVCEMLKPFSKKSSLTGGDLDALDKMTGVVKNIDKILMMEHGGSSQAGAWEAQLRGDYGNNSFANRGQHWVNGHFSRDGNSMQGNSYNYSQPGYSQHGNAMHELEDLLRRVDGAQREELMRAMRDMAR